VQIDWVSVWKYDPTAVAPPPATVPAPTTTTLRAAATRPTGTRYRVIRS